MAKRVRPAAVVICAWLSLVGSHCCVTFGSFLEVVGVLAFRVIFSWNMLQCCICFIANFTELSLHMDVLALIWLKHILALLRYCTCKEGLSVCCWCLPHRALSLFLPLLPSGLWLSLSHFRRLVSKLCVKAQHLLPLPFSFLALLFGSGLSLLRAARG